MNKKQLFIASCIALTATSMTFAIRVKLMDVFGAEMQLTQAEVGWAAGTAFWGFTLSIFLGGILCDYIGMKKLIYIAFGGHLIGIILTIFATNFISLFIGTLSIGLANGMVEAACNPLVTTIYRDKKAIMLNRFHIWFPGGLVIGSLLSYLFIDIYDIDWKYLMLMIVIPTYIYGVMFLFLKFPKTERVVYGVSSKSMYGSLLTPLFIFISLCMLLSASTELGTNQWMEILLASKGISPILILLLISGVMAVGRYFAKYILAKISIVGTLLFSSIFSFIGLLLMSFVSGYGIVFAAFFFAVGICYFWPTMLGFVSQYIPKSGAIGLSVVGGVGMLSVSFILPFIGKINESIASTSDVQVASAQTLQYISILPAALIILFLLFSIFKKKIFTHSKI